MIGVLLRFREKCFIIRDMFHQVKVRREDQVAQQFLWRNGDQKRKTDRYTLQVMTFSASCSPAAANYVKNRNATRFMIEYPEAVSAILQNTFVDDWLQTGDTEEDVTTLACRVRAIHADGGFEMRGWVSNSARVMQTLKETTDQMEKCIDTMEPVRERVPRMWWRTQTDEFTVVQSFRKPVFSEPHTPLGLLGFYIIQAKKILQEIWWSSVC